MNGIPGASARADTGGVPTAQLLFRDELTADNTRVVSAVGELDLASRGRLVSTLTSGHHSATVIDLGGVTFMDCSGYGALIASRCIVEHDGRSLTVRGQTGQPGRLLELIAGVESGRTVEH